MVEVFAKVLALPEIKIGPDAIWTSDLGGDSMSYIEMCQQLNQAFGVEIPQELYGQLGTANAFAKEILDLLKAAGTLDQWSAPKKGKKKRKREERKREKAAKRGK